MDVRPSFLGNGVTAFPFDTEGALVYNSGMAPGQSANSRIFCEWTRSSTTTQKGLFRP